MAEKLKIRWYNGFGDDDGNYTPPTYWFEIGDGKGLIKLNIPLEKMEKFLEENHISTVDLRGGREKELTLKLFEELNGQQLSYQAEYKKCNIKKVSIEFNTNIESDKEIYLKLKSIPNKQALIKKLLKEYYDKK